MDGDQGDLLADVVIEDAPPLVVLDRIEDDFLRQRQEQDHAAAVALADVLGVRRPPRPVPGQAPLF